MQPRVQGRRPGQNHPHREQPAFSRLGMRAHLRFDRAKHAGLVIVRRGVDDDLRPARTVGQYTPHLATTPVGDVDDHRAPLAAFPDAPPLQIAGVDDPWIARDDLEGVDVAERPIVVAARAKIGDRAGRVVLVTRATAGGMQHADVEPPGYRLRIVHSIVLSHVAVRKAASVQRDAQIR